MQKFDLQPWPHGDPGQTAAVCGLIRVGLAEAVRTEAGEHYRLLPPTPDALAPSFTGELDPAVRA